MNQKTFISVILPLKLEWEPCYSLPEGMEAASCCEQVRVGDGESGAAGKSEQVRAGDREGGAAGKSEQVRVGDRVKVAFAGREYSAVVSATGISPEADPAKIKPIMCIEDSLERILPEEIQLWRQVASYYMCTIGEVYKAAYPLGKINLEEAHAEALVKTKERKEKLIESMKSKAERIRARMLRKEELIAGSKEGTKAKARYREELEKIQQELQTAEMAIRNVEEMFVNPPQGVMNDLHIWQDKESIILSEAQERAYAGIREAFAKGKPVLLHGVTGSGKTEIYIKLAQETIREGRNVLYLVPEIALSRQLEERLKEHFGDMLLTFHSGETAASKRNTAETIRTLKKSGNYIVLGTRSSLFLPHHDLGLIIVDEEHDSSYKQDSPAPRYNGRDTALMLSVIQTESQSDGRPCQIILGSATPSLEELYNCECGKHVMIELNERYHGAEEAEIEIIDTKAERRKRGMHGSFSRKLIDHIRATLAEGGQVMVLRSRRAWAPAMQCEECGDIPKCPHCNVSLSYHKTGGMTCHYCGYRTAYTGTCTKCNGPLKSLGAGTQKIEEEAAALFPEAAIARLDSDTARNKSYEKKTIKAFSKGETDILIGTQMLAKGFDFSKLRLVAVIAADSMLGMQDFRADEKAVQLLEQFRGRCGRRGTKGMFVIQTSQPEHPIYQHIASNSPEQFNTSLLDERKMFGFPPYTRIIEITVRDTYEDRAERMVGKLAAELTAHTQQTGQSGAGGLTGPYSPVVDKVADQHIRAIRISLPKDSRLKGSKAAIMQAIRDFEKTNRYDGHITVNVDPS